MRILLAEDDFTLSDVISKMLNKAGYIVDCFHRGEDAQFALSVESYHLMLLDLGLPDVDGTEVIRRLRLAGNSIPILILTARGTLEERVSGLNLGADDYLTKPFDLPELEARIRALIRRRHFATRNEIIHGAIRFLTDSRQVLCGDEPIELSIKELAVLEVLLSHIGKVVSKEKLLNHLYGWDETVSRNAIEVYVHRLRKKLEPYGFTIDTIKGLGYYVVDQS